MIFVQEQPEPADFTRKVRTPGQAFLRRVPRPTSKQFKPERHWRHCLSDLYAAYNGICAYSAQWIPPHVSRAIGSVDHYIPKHVAPWLAYEWSNYRLCTEKMNNNKDDFMDVIDPFMIQDGWFTIDFATFLIEPEDSLPDYLKAAVGDTITRLQLNDDDTLVQDRANQVQLYADGDVSFDFLKRRYPFIASELARQGLREDIKTRMRKLSSS